MHAQASFSDPAQIPVTITLTGTLAEFEDLRSSMTDVPFHKVRSLLAPSSITLTGTLAEFEDLRSSMTDAPFHKVRSLLEQINDASRKLRAKVEAAPCQVTVIEDGAK